MDVEEYFQVNAFDGVVARDTWPRFPSRLEHPIERLLEMLARHGTTATFFVLGWIAERHPQIVRRIASGGHEIASHGWSHRRVSTLSRGELDRELRDSKSLLEDLSGAAVLGFRAPSFSITPSNPWAFDVLVEAGYRYDSSVFPIRRPGYGFPSAPLMPHRLERTAGPLLEIPLATLALGPLRVPAAGGGYLRHFPLQLVRSAVRAAERSGRPAMLYIHPWELDPEQPRLEVGALTRLRHYRGLARVAPRLERLMSEFRFTSVERSTDPVISSMLAGRNTADTAVPAERRLS